MKKDFRKFIIALTKKLDSQLQINLYPMVRNIGHFWHDSPFTNGIRAEINYGIVKMKYSMGISPTYPLKLHLGCGNIHFKGYINIDFRKTPAADIVFNIKKLPYKDNSVEIIENYHVIEHLPRRELNGALREWYRILMVGGKLVIECPDFDKIVKKYLAGDEKQLDHIFGLQRYPEDTHYFGYNFKRLKKILEGIGFKDIQDMPPYDYHTKDEDCIRVECTK